MTALRMYSWLKTPFWIYRRKTIKPVANSAFRSEKDILSTHAAKITAEIQQGERKGYNEVLNLSSGDLHSMGIKPITFIRQDDSLPLDVKERAKCLLRECEGGSVGSCTDSSGIAKIKQDVSKFISSRDGGVPSSPENIFLTSGSQRGLMIILKLLFQSKDSSCQTGVLIPVPSYASFNLAMAAQGIVMVPYQLCEEQGWTLEVEELHRALRSGRTTCNPMAIYICNPGNPTGHIQSKESIKEVIQFAAEEKLLLMIDEVYQNCLYGEGPEFYSYKKVLSEMGSTVEVVSFNSASKGFMGECGLRGGYMELVNFDPTVMQHIRNFFYTEPITPVAGQIAVDLMANPPKPGDPSFPIFSEEVESTRNTIRNNIHRTQKFLDELPGISCQPLKGGFFVFARLHVPPKAIEWAKNRQMELDLLYCLHLLEETGLHVRPGCEFGQKKDTHHIRLCLATQEEMMEDVLQRLKTFHLRFMKEFS
nr:alanine aminotransferase 2 isoform X2 [Misgurnus anguillicaudatus]